MKMITNKIKIALFLLFVVAKVGAQTAVLKVEGELLTPLSLSIQDLSAMPQTRIKTKDRDAKEHEYTGVLLYEILKKAGATLGPELKGKNMSKLVLLKAADAYEVVYALAELDPEFTNDQVLLAYQMDGSPLPAGEGPFRLVTPADKKHARWIRQVSSIKVLVAKE